MQHAPLSRRTMLRTLGTAAVAVAPAFIRHAGAQALTRVSYQTGWLPQPDKGGLYQAKATGIYKDYGLDVDIRSGGPQMNENQIFLAGKVEFADSDSFRVLNFVQESLPGIAVAAFGQKSLAALLSHPGSGAESLAALKGRPVLVSAIGRQTYWKWLKAKYGLADEQLRPYTNSMAPFLADKSVTMEGFVTSEPFDVARAGIKPVVHVLADQGYANYSNVMLASPKLVAEKPELVQRFVDATIKGWASYLRGDPTPGNQLIKQGNPEMSDEKIAFAIDALRRHGIIESGDAAVHGLGAMSDARWRSFYESMAAASVMPQGVPYQKGYTLQFVNKRLGMV
jgi:NitT/TauT family transport system substrate-binding protein